MRSTLGGGFAMKLGMNRCSFVAAVGLGCGLLGGLSGAQATPITLSDSSPGVIKFTGNGAGSLTVSTPGLTGGAFVPGITVVGTYTLGPATLVGGPETPAGLCPTLRHERVRF